MGYNSGNMAMLIFFIATMLFVLAIVFGIIGENAVRNESRDARSRHRPQHRPQPPASATRASPARYRASPSSYRYFSKRYIMTKPEAYFFRRLERIAGAKYYVFPQISIASLLDHKEVGQDWRAALSKIQRKSVDFVLVHKETLVTVYAIELDDRSHDNPNRIRRDDFVNQIFREAGLRLVRFRDTRNMSELDIVRKLQESSRL